MTRFYGILTVAAALVFASCESNNGNQAASNNNPNDERAYNNSRWDNNASAANNQNAPRRYAEGDNGLTAKEVNNSRGSDKIGTAISTDDRVFLVDAATGGSYEVASSELALTKTNDGNIKTIAQHMIDDHKKVNDSLATLAKSKNVMVGTAPSIAQAQMIDKLRGLNGQDFDREYISQQRTAHQETIAKFQTAANNSQDREIRAFAAENLPTLRDHLRMIEGQTGNTVGMNQ